MTEKEIEDLIENDYELIWETTHLERDGDVKVVARPLKLIRVKGSYSASLWEFVRKQEPGYRILTIVEKEEKED